VLFFSGLLFSRRQFDIYSSTSAPPLSQVMRIVDTYSTMVNHPTQESVRNCSSNARVDCISLCRVGYIQGPDCVGYPDPGYDPPEIFSHRIRSSDVLYGMIFKPPEMEAGKKYPTLLAVYGGPKVQLVTNSFKSSKQSRNHFLAAMGYCVVCIDGRGSEHRGHEFEAHLYRRMVSRFIYLTLFPEIFIKSSIFSNFT
jgi:hypothetical protein